MLALKIRIAQALKEFGLHPRSEIENLQQQHRRDHDWLVKRNEQLQKRNEELQRRIAQLKRAKQPAMQEAGARRKYQTSEDEPIWHRRVIGARWEEIGQLQIDFLRARGLQPQHYLLDVGCGSLRGGVRFIPYLEAGHYYGVDRNQKLLDGGRIEIESADLQDHRPNLIQMDDFGFERLDQTFDFAIANSVFTHLPLNVISRCLVNVDRVMRPGGTFYATFFENPEGRRYVEPLEQGDGFYSYYDKDPFHYTRDTLEWACEGTGLTANYVGDWGHPRHQVMMEFRKAV